jgi:peptidoglycan/LPS O-acetylase OafA/YrhL
MHRNNFDFMRLFAAALVFFDHQFALVGDIEPEYFGTKIGHIAVFVFFSISGYLVAQSWLRSPNVFAFAKNRLLRVWPGFAVVTLLALFVLGPLFTALPLSNYFSSPLTWRYLENLAFVVQYELPGVFGDNPYPNAVNGSIWSIPIEMECYALLALLGLSGLLKRRWILLAGTIIFVIAATAKQTISGVTVRPLTQFGGFFAIGCCIGAFKETVLAHRVTILFATSLLTIAGSLFGFGYQALFIVIPFTTIICGTASTRPFNHAGRFGDFSYGFYLYAFPVQQTLMLLLDRKTPFVVLLASGAVITYACAVLSWKMIEGPAMRLKRRRADAPPSAGVAA